jgi:L-ribulose-5-phosphate 4-epimerase
MLEDLKREVCRVNRALVEHGLVRLTFGNVSGIDQHQKLVVIKPSGVPYGGLVPEQMLVVDLEGNVVDGNLRPSTDTATHVRLYNHFEGVGGITHVHSRFATMFAQARREIACYGTTHADYFNGPVPVTRSLTQDEVQQQYETNTARVILERFDGVDPVAMPAVLVAGHGPFTWGKDATESLDNAVALETVAEMAFGTEMLRADTPILDRHLLDKHYQRKHGDGAYYGQG